MQTFNSLQIILTAKEVREVLLFTGSQRVLADLIATTRKGQLSADNHESLGQVIEWQLSIGPKLRPSEPIGISVCPGAYSQGIVRFCES